MQRPNQSTFLGIRKLLNKMDGRVAGQKWKMHRISDSYCHFSPAIVTDVSLELAKISEQFFDIDAWASSPGITVYSP